MSKGLVVRWLGQVSYQHAWDLQERLAGDLAGRQPPILLLLEHPIASLADLLQPVQDMQQVRQAIVQAFSEKLDYQIIEEIHPFPGSSDEQRFDT